MAITLSIHNRSTIYIPVVESGIVWETQRKGTPGKLTFTVVKDEALNFEEGDLVEMSVGNQPVFCGFIFTKKCDKSSTVDIVAYDQLRYLKNKDTVIYEGKKASELIKMLAHDFNLRCGTIEDTGYIIESGVEENAALFDIIQNALDETLQVTGNLFVLYDNFGKLSLTNIQNMKLDLLIDKESAENMEYISSIDQGTANVVKLMYQGDSNQWKPIIRQDLGNIERWGVLQYYEQVQSPMGASEKAAALLRLYNQKTRKLTIKNAFGDPRVRAGTSIAVLLNLGDSMLRNFMVVEKVKHTWNDESDHFMDLTLIGGEFVD